LAFQARAAALLPDLVRDVNRRWPRPRNQAR